jgi:ribonuclease HII
MRFPAPAIAAIRPEAGLEENRRRANARRMSPGPGADSRLSRPARAGDAPDFSRERRLIASGHRAIAGIDEAGRGPLAGPVVAAAVILDPGNIPPGLDDSKRLTAGRREALFARLLGSATLAFASVPAEEIDRTDIRAATLAAMTMAAHALAVAPDAALIDGRDVPDGLAAIGQAVIGGDRHSLSIAAASIVAKVMRDRMMAAADLRWPQWGFGRHKGYGAPAHLRALTALGASPLHRLSFAPLARRGQP